MSHLIDWVTSLWRRRGPPGHAGEDAGEDPGSFEARLFRSGEPHSVDGRPGLGRTLLRSDAWRGVPRRSAHRSGVPASARGGWHVDTTL